MRQLGCGLVLIGTLACSPRPEGPWTREAALAPTLARVEATGAPSMSAGELDALITERDPAALQSLAGRGISEEKAKAPQGEGQQAGGAGGRGKAGKLGKAGKAGKVGKAGKAEKTGKAAPGEGARTHIASAEGPDPHATCLQVEALRQEVLALRPDAPIASEAEVGAVCLHRGLSDPAIQALLSPMFGAAAEAGLPLPAGLPAAAGLSAGPAAGATLSAPRAPGGPPSPPEPPPPRPAGR